MHATRWSAVMEAWQALLRVRHMSQDLIKEEQHLSRGDAPGQARSQEPSFDTDRYPGSLKAPRYGRSD
jgi:hypothetical protein